MWNIVLENFLKLKSKFIEVYGEDSLWNYGEYANCVEYWASKFEEFQEIFAPLIITEYNDFILLRYSLLDTDAEFWEKYDQMYRECRSVVLDKKNDCLVLTPFRKFFNVNEVEETQERYVLDRISNAEKVEVSEKLDGSMQNARYYNGEYILAGSRALDPEMGFRVKLGYRMLTEDYKTMLRENPEWTFTFEFIHKKDSHVVHYTEEQEGLYLIGIRSAETGYQMPYTTVVRVAEMYGVKHTNVVDKTFAQLMNELDEKTSDEAEGFVIDIDGWKVKLKYNDYRKIHHMLAKVTSTNVIIRCIDDGSYDDVISKVPMAYREDIEIVAKNVREYVKKKEQKVKKLYEECKELYPKFDENADRKSFAIYTKEHYKPYMGYLMNMYDGKENTYLHNRAGKYLKYHEISRWLNENK